MVVQGLFFYNIAINIATHRYQGKVILILILSPSAFSAFWSVRSLYYISLIPKERKKLYGEDIR